MMRLVPPPRRRREAEIVPMINVAFLLLVFFLLVARIAPPEPFDLDLPEGEAAAEAREGDTLYIAADGTLAFEGARGEAVFDALRGRGDSPLLLRADGALEGAALARLLARLTAMGITRIELALAIGADSD